jgi:serine/threonine-protein kinase HipA
MSLNGKRDRFERADLAAVAEAISLSKPGALLDEIADTIRRWPEFAQQAGVNEKVIREIADHHALI